MWIPNNSCLLYFQSKLWRSKTTMSVYKNLAFRHCGWSSISGKGNAVSNNLASTNSGITYLKSLFIELSKHESNENFRIIMGDVNADKFQSQYMPNCGYGQTILRISPSGDVFPCILSDLKLGDLCTEKIIDIQKRHSRKLEKISPPCTALCAGCEFENVCNNCINEGVLNSDKLHTVCRWKKQLPRDLSWIVIWKLIMNTELKFHHW